MATGATLTALVFTFLGAVGCAHQQPTPEAPVAARAPAAAPKPGPAPEPTPTPPDDGELMAILSGAVLHFEFNRADLTPESSQRLTRVAEALRAHPAARVRVAGHCDERGTQEYNLALGHQRAEAARGYLVALGIAAARIETVSYGAESPVERGHHEQAWARNRRDELTRLR